MIFLSDVVLTEENLFQTKLILDKGIINIGEKLRIYLYVENLSDEVQQINQNFFVYPSWKLFIRGDNNVSYFKRDIYAETLKLLPSNKTYWNFLERIRQERTGLPPRPFPGYPAYYTIEPGEQFVYTMICEYNLISYQNTELYALIFDSDATRFIIPNDLNRVLISFFMRIDETRILDSNEVLLQLDKAPSGNGKTGGRQTGLGKTGGGDPIYKSE